MSEQWSLVVQWLSSFVTRIVRFLFVDMNVWGVSVGVFLVVFLLFSITISFFFRGR